MRIGQKLILGFLVVAVLVGAVGYIGVNFGRRIGGIFESVEKAEIPSVVALVEMKAKARKASIKSMEYSMRGEERDKQKATEALEMLDAKLEVFKQAVEMEKILAAEEEEEEAIRVISEKVATFKKAVSEYVLLSAGPSLEELSAKQQEFYQARKAVIGVVKPELEKADHPIDIKLWKIKAESRKLSVKAYEYYMLGGERQKLKANQAQKDLAIYLTDYKEAIGIESEVAKDIDAKVKSYIIKGKEYIDSIDQKAASPSTLLEKQEEVHQARKALIHALYDHVDYEQKELDKAVAKTKMSITNLTKITLLSGLVVFFVAISLGILFSRAISAPIAKLRDAAGEIGKGKLDTKIEIKSNDEIGDLAASFTRMAKDLGVSMEKEKEFAAAAAAAAAAADKKRTADLEKAYKELEEKSKRLERFSKITVGREREMVRLKKEINFLLEKSGQPKKYEAPEKMKGTEEKE